MNLSTCTISFRHQLISLKQIALWAERSGFNGIELWGVHARNLGHLPECDRDWLKSLGLSVSMLSDYLPVAGEERSAVDKTIALSELTTQWGAKKLRTFAGDKPSHDISASERQCWVRRLRELCVVAHSYGIYLVVETHPNTLADTLPSTLQLLEEVDHPALKINFDVIHVWESGCDPIKAFCLLESSIVHMHLKNIVNRASLAVFMPANVYAPAGSRAGMASLFEGAFDFRGFLSFVKRWSCPLWENLDASLEWFGPDVFATLERDALEISKIRAAEKNQENAGLEHIG